MSDIKVQQKKFLRAELAGKTMEYLTGLNEEHEPAIRRMVAKATKKIVSTYYQAIKQQRKKVLVQTAKKVKENKKLTGTEPVLFTEQTNLSVC